MSAAHRTRSNIGMCTVQAACLPGHSQPFPHLPVKAVPSAGFRWDLACGSGWEVGMAPREQLRQVEAQRQGERQIAGIAPVALVL